MNSAGKQSSRRFSARLTKSKVAWSYEVPIKSPRATLQVHHVPPVAVGLAAAALELFGTHVAFDQIIRSLIRRCLHVCRKCPSAACARGERRCRVSERVIRCTNHYRVGAECERRQHFFVAQADGNL